MKDKIISRVLFLLQLPPPIHGVSVINQTIKSSENVNQSFDCEYLDISPSDKISDIGWINLSKLIRMVMIFARAIYLIAVFRPKLVYITLAPIGVAFWKDSLLLLIAKAFLRRRVVHLHGKGIDKEVKANSFKRFYYRFVFRGCHIIHLAPSLTKDVLLVADRSMISILPNGVLDTGRKTLKEKNEGENPLKVVYLSNFVREKGAMNILRSIPLIDAKERAIQFFFTGKFYDKKFESEFKSKLSKLVHEFNIILIDGLYDQEKSKLLNDCDIFVLPSNNDCFPLTILEALCHGMPVITTREGAIPDIIKHKDNGLLVAKNSPQDIADAIYALYSSSDLLEQMQVRARASYEKYYSLDIFERRLVTILSDCLD